MYENLLLQVIQTLIYSLARETNLDDVLQISNVFVNVSKGEVAKHGDLKKCFGTTDIPDIVTEVLACSSFLSYRNLIRCQVDPQERRDASQREGARS